MEVIQVAEGGTKDDVGIPPLGLFVKTLQLLIK